MNKESNTYIFTYSAVLVIIVAVLLTAAALWLQPYQQRNKENEERINILKAAGIADVNKDNTTQLFEQHCTATLTLDENGKNTENGELKLYVIDNQTSVIPMRGNGLWGPIWGYIAIAPDGTIIGANFDHKSETPGLGGEITTDKFQSQFAGKQFMSNGKQLPIEVDAITGATKTSNGVKEMIDKTMQMYLPYFESITSQNGEMK